MATTTDVGTHAETIKMDIDQIAHNLINHLGPTLVALLANVKDRKLPYRWARREGRPTAESTRRLIAAHRAWLQVSAADSDHVARLWFVGENPLLDEVSPIEALREGRITDVLRASQDWTSSAWATGAADDGAGAAEKDARKVKTKQDQAL